jgi:hypothetical protein
MSGLTCKGKLLALVREAEMRAREEDGSVLAAFFKAKL